jgi:hypothetical protein
MAAPRLPCCREIVITAICLSPCGLGIRARFLRAGPSRIGSWHKARRHTLGTLNLRMEEGQMLVRAEPPAGTNPGGKSMRPTKVRFAVISAPTRAGTKRPSSVCFSSAGQRNPGSLGLRLRALPLSYNIWIQADRSGHIEADHRGQPWSGTDCAQKYRLAGGGGSKTSCKLNRSSIGSASSDRQDSSTLLAVRTQMAMRTASPSTLVSKPVCQPPIPRPDDPSIPDARFGSGGENHDVRRSGDTLTPAGPHP